MMDDEVDFDDLLGEERVVESMTTKPSTSSFSGPPPPSSNEIRLGRRVLELEKEREVYMAELEELRSRQTAPPTTLSPNAESMTLAPITIPHGLLPTLDVLRRHISELTRDNAALRYTFLGQHYTSSSSPSAGSSGGRKIEQHLDRVSITDDQGIEGSDRIRNGAHGVDLEKVVSRVKAIMLENEELGDMVLEVGMNEGMNEEWGKALEESKAVIRSLDSDLTHHLSTIQSLRSEIQSLKSSQSHPPPQPNHHRPTHSKTPSMSLNPSSSVFSPPRGPAQRGMDVNQGPGPGRGQGATRGITGQAPISHSAGPSMAVQLTGVRGKHKDGEMGEGKEPPKGPRDDRDVKRRR